MTAARRAATLTALALALVAVVAGTRLALRRALALRATWPAEADVLYLPKAGVLRLASLGHPELAADLVAARANVYFGGQLQTRSEQKWLERYLTTAVELDPKFRALYLRGAAMLVYNGREIDVPAVEAANRLLERGMREFPGDWEIPFQLGVNLLFELPKLVDADDARVADWRQRGVDVLRQTTLLEGVPPWLPVLAAQMLTRQGADELAIRHLEQTYAVTSNEQTREEIARKLVSLQTRHLASELARGAAQLREAVARRYPYAPEAFSLVAGPRFERGVDLEALISASLGAAREAP